MSIAKWFPSKEVHIGLPGLTHRLLEVMGNAGIAYSIENPDVPRFEVTKAGTDDRHS